MSPFQQLKELFWKVKSLYNTLYKHCQLGSFTVIWPQVAILYCTSLQEAAMFDMRGFALGFVLFCLATFLKSYPHHLLCVAGLNAAHVLAYPSSLWWPNCGSQSSDITLSYSIHAVLVPAAVSKFCFNTSVSALSFIIICFAIVGPNSACFWICQIVHSCLLVSVAYRMICFWHSLPFWLCALCTCSCVYCSVWQWESGLFLHLNLNIRALVATCFS